MRIFVSYSRRDEAVVRRIVDRLEAAGHDVWIDTDDIVGSERWRASIAEAITSSDVVVLVESPAAMRSENVEREITVAAEADRRVVPVVLEPADLPMGLVYDLAGVQRISFVDRDVDEAMADLLVALARPSPDRSPRAAIGSSGSSGAPLSVPKRRPRWPVVAGLAVAGSLAVVGVVLWTTGGDTTGAAPAREITTTVATGRDEVGVVGSSFDTTVWFAGFSVRATAAHFDDADREARIDVVLTNDQHGAADPCALLLDAAVVAGGRRSTVWTDQCTWLPPGSSTRATLEAALGADVEFAGASLEFGGAEEHRAVIPLDGGPGTAERPTSVPIDGTLAGDLSEFTAEDVEVVPAACSGLSDSLGFAPGPSDQMSVVVTGSATSHHAYPLGYGKARLTLPDGTIAASSSLSGVIYAIDPDQTVRDVRACFVVPAPVAGRYEFTIASDGDEAFPDPITLTF